MSDTAIRVLTPAFFKNFQCSGADCPSSCCHSWQVTVDKKAFKQLKKSNDPVIKKLSQTHLKLSRKSDANYGSFAMRADSYCPMQDEKGLCEIHKRCGHKALPVTCQVYPRHYLRFGEQLELSLTLSCPEVSKSILFDPEALIMEENLTPIEELKGTQVSGNSNPPTWLEVVRQFSFRIATQSQLSLEERLFIIGVALKQAEPHLDNTERLQTLFDNVIAMQADGSLQELYDSLPVVHELKWTLFSKLDLALVAEIAGKTKQSISKNDREFLGCQQQLIKQIHLYDKTNEEIDNPDRILACNPSSSGDAHRNLYQQANDKVLKLLFENNPQLETNYLLYCFYHFQFMSKDESSPIPFFKVLVADWLMLKSYLAGMALANEELNEEDINTLFYQYARKRQHNENFVKRVKEQFATFEEQYPNVMLGLLKS